MKRLCVVVVAAIALAACGGSSASTTTTTTVTADTLDTANTFEYTITVGKNTGPEVVIDVVQGKVVTLNVVNPASHDDVHLHGYDLSTGSIEKGEAGTMMFTATQVGDFEIESHETQELLATLRVTAP